MTPTGLCREAPSRYQLQHPAGLLSALRAAAVREESALGRRTLEPLVRNYEVAAAERTPGCQDIAGLPVAVNLVSLDAPCLHHDVIVHIGLDPRVRIGENLARLTRISQRAAQEAVCFIPSPDPVIGWPSRA